MDSIDRTLLNKLQREFPLVLNPYAALAKDLGITEQEVLSRIKALVNQKIIRKIGASVAPRKINHTTTLVAASVLPEKLEQVAQAINAYPQVTHNYGRENELNLWFTLVGKDRAEIEGLCREISGLDGVIRLVELPTTHLFKLDVFFDIVGESAQ
jgi:siroheme decarboxylase